MIPLKDLPGDETSACFVTNSLNIYWSVRNIPSVILSEVFWYKIYTTKLYLTTVHEFQFIDIFSNLAMLTCCGKKRNNAIFQQKNPKKTKQTTTTTTTTTKIQPGHCEHGISAVQQTEKHSKSWNLRGDRFLTNFSKVAFSENWLQIYRFWKLYKASNHVGY